MLSTLFLLKAKIMQTTSITFIKYVGAILNFIGSLLFKMDFITEVNPAELRYYQVKRANKADVLD